MENKCLEIYHQSCKNCNKEIREKRIVKGFCKETVSKIDGLPVRCVGEWSKEKIYRLTQYFGIFANGMKKKWKNKLNYIEICSGPGRCIERESGLEFDGTSLAILNHKSFKLIKNAIFIDLSSEVVFTLNKRIDKQRKSSFAKAIECDYNNTKEIKSILSELTPNYLNLVLLDHQISSVQYRFITYDQGWFLDYTVLVHTASNGTAKGRIIAKGNMNCAQRLFVLENIADYFSSGIHSVLLFNYRRGKLLHLYLQF